MQRFLHLLLVQALGADPHVLAEVFDGVSADVQRGGHVAHVVAQADEGAAQVVLQLGVQRGAAGLGAQEQVAGPVLELVAAEAIGAECALDAGVLELALEQGHHGDGGQGIGRDGADADGQASPHAAG